MHNHIKNTEKQINIFLYSKNTFLTMDFNLDISLYDSSNINYYFAYLSKVDIFSIPSFKNINVLLFPFISIYKEHSFTYL